MYKTVVLLLLLGVFSSEAKIITTDKIEDIENEFAKADEKTLGIFDCDDVLTVNSSQILQKPHREVFLELRKKEFPGDSREKLCDRFTEIASLDHVFLVDERMPTVVKKLQNGKIKTMVLTALSGNTLPLLADPVQWRANTLKSFGYCFEGSFPSLKSKNFNILGYQSRVRYSHGVVCCGKVSKSDALKAFLSYAGFCPSKIIFIDDARENLEKMEQFCVENKIAFVGIEYTKVYKIKNKLPFSKERAEFQVKKFKEKNIWFSDEEAEKEMK
ncbi:hypothetical protein FACS1894122_01650 [Alphaproteobacteria bacterium]|nr:hypothetical protein FACS1894122_01650 [Alphaproteobacteria bacterium]